MALFDWLRRASRRAEHASARIGEATSLFQAEVRISEGLVAHPDRPEVFRAAAGALLRFQRPELAELMVRAADAPDDIYTIVRLASELTSLDQAHSAAALLERALAFAPFDAVIRSELALAQLCSGQPEKARETLALHPGLVDDPGALFEFAWASLLVGDLDSARGAAGELEGRRRPLAEPLRRALERWEGFGAPSDARSFLFVTHGALLLDASGEGAGRYGENAPFEVALGRAVAGLQVAVDALELKVRSVALQEPSAEPVGDRVAEALGAELVPRRADLVVAVAADALSEPPAHRAMAFAVEMSWRRRAAWVPDFVGRLGEDRGPTEQQEAPALSKAEAGALRSFVGERRDALPPRGSRTDTAYLPDAPLPWPSGGVT